jgi:hypothetical protein
MPITHNVVTTYADGATYTHGARSIGAAENWATGERRKIGKPLISRSTGETRIVVSVNIVIL